MQLTLFYAACGDAWCTYIQIGSKVRHQTTRTNANQQWADRPVKNNSRQTTAAAPQRKLKSAVFTALC
jgi:hypothetical protein